MTSSKDNLYSKAEADKSSFVFDQHVASVFADMISRSVPGYKQIIDMLPTLTRLFRVESANYYDLGCSLGAGLLAIAQGLEDTQATLIGIDNSSAMLGRAKQNLKPINQTVQFIEEDLQNTQLNNAAMVLMNFTLQFIAPEARQTLIEAIYHGMRPGGVLILSEKIRFDTPRTQSVFTDIHHQYKFDQGYSKLEISRKRDAIDEVLIPETLNKHISRLNNCGFEMVTPWVQNLQFVSLLAIK